MAQTDSYNGQNRWRLEGMTALVTGGTKGLGLAVVEEFAEIGAIVRTCAWNEAELNECLRDWKIKGFNVTGSVCDASSRAERQKLVNGVSTLFNRKLNIHINNVGTNISKLTVDHTAEDFSMLGATVHICFSTETELNECIHQLQMKGSKVVGSVCDVSSRVE